MVQCLIDWLSVSMPSEFGFPKIIAYNKWIKCWRIVFDHRLWSFDKQLINEFSIIMPLKLLSIQVEGLLVFGVLMVLLLAILNKLIFINIINDWIVINVIIDSLNYIVGFLLVFFEINQWGFTAFFIFWFTWGLDGLVAVELGADFTRFGTFCV